MKMRCIFLVLLIATAASVAAQSRDAVRIYIPPVVAVDYVQADYFQKNFAMELTGAGYTVTEDVMQADYSMRLRVRANMAVSADGTPGPVPPGENQYTLQITVMRNSDNAQIVAFSFGFSELEEMYHHNLTLVYQAMANVPLSRSDGDKTLVRFMVGKDEERKDWWQNKWLYFRLSIDFPIIYDRIRPDGLYDGSIFEGDSIEDPGQHSKVAREITAMPGATAGLEFQFLNWMSLEANFQVRLWDAVGFVFIPGIGLQLKFPIKPSNHFMLEPYGAAVISLNNDDRYIAFPRYSVGGGLQFGIRGGKAGVLFFDANYMYSLSEVVTYNSSDLFPHPEELHWNRFVIGLGLGFRFGIINRGEKREENSTWLFND